MWRHQLSNVHLLYFMSKAVILHKKCKAIVLYIKQVSKEYSHAVSHD